MKEQWKDIPKYEGLYQASDMGRIRSLDRRVGKNNQFFKGVILKNCIRASGYYSISLSKDNTVKTCRVHRLILLTFEGMCPEGMEGCHNNGNSFDNKLSNLRWDTCKNNIEDKKKHGTWQCGEKHGNSKLKNEEVVEIKKMLSVDGLSDIEISKKFNISRGTIYDIRVGRNWKHITV